MSVKIDGAGNITGLVAGGLPDATVTNDELVTMDGAKVTGNIAAAQITSALNASGSAPVYACRAWVNFNGQGTVAIRASGNVSSITDNGTGDYTVNFTTAMPNVNYSAVMSCGEDYTGNSGLRVANALNNTLRSTTAIRVGVSAIAAGLNRVSVDDGEVSVSIFR